MLHKIEDVWGSTMSMEKVYGRLLMAHEPFDSTESAIVKKKPHSFGCYGRKAAERQESLRNCRKVKT